MSSSQITKGPSQPSRTKGSHFLCGPRFSQERNTTPSTSKRSLVCSSKNFKSSGVSQTKIFFALKFCSKSPIKTNGKVCNLGFQLVKETATSDDVFGVTGGSQSSFRKACNACWCARARIREAKARDRPRFRIKRHPSGLLRIFKRVCIGITTDDSNIHGWKSRSRTSLGKHQAKCWSFAKRMERSF